MINTKLLHDFVANWTGKGYEKGESQPFWLDLLHAFWGTEFDCIIRFSSKCE